MPKKGYRHSEEAKNKMSLSRIGKRGFKHSEETKEKIRLKQKGRMHKPQEGFKIGHKGFNGFTGKNHTQESKYKISKSLKGKNLGVEHWNWKGGFPNDVHGWLKNLIGNAQNYKCKCGKTAKDWANKDHKYKRDVNDYIPMCRSCHRIYDINYNHYKNYAKKM